MDSGQRSQAQLIKSNNALPNKPRLETGSVNISQAVFFENKLDANNSHQGQAIYLLYLL